MTVIVSALVAFGVALTTTLLTGRQRTREWLRDQRLAAYIELVEAAQAVRNLLLELDGSGRWGTDDRDARAEIERAKSAYNTAASKVMVVGPDDVVEAADALRRAWRDLADLLGATREPLPEQRRHEVMVDWDDCFRRVCATAGGAVVRYSVLDPGRN